MAKELGGTFVPFLILLLTAAAFGDPNPKSGQFSDYINSRDNSQNSTVNATINHETAPSRENAESGPEWKGAIPAEWRSCQADSECTAAVADCATWEPLNKNFVPQLSKYVNSCTASIDPGFQPQTVCVEKECQETDKTTGVSWKEWLSAMKGQKGS